MGRKSHIHSRILRRLNPRLQFDNDIFLKNPLKYSLPCLDSHVTRFLQCFFHMNHIIYVLIRVVYLTFEWLWSLARDTFAPVWSMSEDFLLTNLVIKSLQKIRFENIQNRRPHGSSIKHGGFWDFWMCRASADDQSPDIPVEIRWILGKPIRAV